MLRHLRSITSVCVLMVVFVVTALQVSAQYDPLTPFVSWSPDGQLLAVSHNTAVTIYDANTMMPLNSIANLDLQYVAATWSPDGTRLAVVNGHNLHIWQQAWSPGDAQQRFIYRGSERYDPSALLSPITHIVWSPDGDEIAVANGDIIDIIDTEAGTFLREIVGDWGRINDLDWFVDDRFALSSNYDRFGYVVDASTGSILNYFYTGGFATESSDVGSVAFSPDRNRFAVGTSDGIIALWINTQTAEYTDQTPDLLFGNLGDQRHQLRVDTMEWSPTGQFIASGSRDGTVRIWDAATGEQLEQIDLGEGVHVNSVAWSPDGNKLAYGNADGSVTLFDTTQLPGYAPMATAEASS